MALPGKIERRGGARPNSGPKKQTLSVRQVQEMRKRADEYAKKHGKDLFQVLLGWIYDEGVALKDRMAATKIYMDKMMITVSEGGEADKAGVGPSVYLPEQRPSLEVVKDKEQAA